ncbi:MAG: hypothetical protein J7605_02750 [Variovorax sp.]|nr:hypothetical protein [Variovorax sp.]
MRLEHPKHRRDAVIAQLAVEWATARARRVKAASVKRKAYELARGRRAFTPEADRLRAAEAALAHAKALEREATRKLCKACPVSRDTDLPLADVVVGIEE